MCVLVGLCASELLSTCMSGQLIRCSRKKEKKKRPSGTQDVEVTSDGPLNDGRALRGHGRNEGDEEE